MSWGAKQRDMILKTLANGIRHMYKPYLPDHEQLGDIIDTCVEEMSDPTIYELLTQYGLDEAYSDAYNSYPRPTIRQVMYVLHEHAWLMYKNVPLN